MLTKKAMKEPCWVDWESLTDDQKGFVFGKFVKSGRPLSYLTKVMRYQSRYLVAPDGAVIATGMMPDGRDPRELFDNEN